MATTVLGEVGIDPHLQGHQHPTVLIIDDLRFQEELQTQCPTAKSAFLSNDAG